MARRSECVENRSVFQIERFDNPWDCGNNHAYAGNHQSRSCNRTYCAGLGIVRSLLSRCSTVVEMQPVNCRYNQDAHRKQHNT